MFPIFPAFTAFSILMPAASRLKSWLFGSNKRPRPGSIVRCGLMGAFDHSGVYVGNGQIVELEGEGVIRSIAPDEFLNSSELRTGTTIYVACDMITGTPLSAKRVAERARNKVGGSRDYFVLWDNCHRFSSGCVSNDFENWDKTFTQLSFTIAGRMNHFIPIRWEVWDHEDDEEKSADGLDELLHDECGELDHDLIQGHEIAGDRSVRPQLHDELRSWQEKMASEMRQKFTAQFAELEAATSSLKANNFSRDDIQSDLKSYRSADPHASTTHNETELSQRLDDELKPLRIAVQAEWRRSLERQRSEYYLNEIARRRAELLKELNGRLVAMQDIAEVAKELGMEPGLLWDQTKGVGARTDLKTLQRWADYLKNDAGVRSLCDLLGRMRRYSASQRMELIKSAKTFQVTIPDIEAKSEIVGITQGRDIDHILPQELALLADPDTEILFDLKFAEGRLMSFDYAGSIEASYEREQEEMESVEEEDKLGPMIICVDTSGSMNGEPENVAKSITLALAMKSMEQKRACYLISFSSGIDGVKSRDLTATGTLGDLLDFLELSFGGGTDAAPALQEGMKMMKTNTYDRADLLMISDFDMPGITTELKCHMDEAKERGCKFYALNIGPASGSAPRFKDFDKDWQYDPATMGIKELNGIVDNLCG